MDYSASPSIIGKTSRNHVIDLRSDTVSKPTPGMRKAMAEADVGDDVYGDDPTVNALESRFAELLGKDVATFFPSGTQSNLAAMMSHCGRGDEILVGNSYHTFKSEAGGASALGGIVFCPLPIEPDCSLHPDVIRAAIKPDDPHMPRTRLLCLENTVSGTAIPLVTLTASAATARNAGLAIHLDGARLFNAATELGIHVRELASVADTVSVCLSKGLGSPAGTLLASSADLKPQIRRNRKILGGGMRQTGILASAAIYALDHHVDRLSEDHRRAKLLAEGLRSLPDGSGIEVRQATNMLFVTPRREDHGALVGHLAARGISVGTGVPTMRFVVHLGIDDSDIETTIDAFSEFYAKGPVGQ